ncbi:M20/M25/M40 family metallo-hydrolase [Marispirochaeta sp.]|jgi:acetylornithine deacetylase|uniref:M20 family metallopeptidase n=1 Tax=Marispirochaeta sp. TaxID=2038653 RepID=UPI0029C6FB23|nr:M20/M25/M40 family metallo-hydrolase [Marispirochaeta sp.]
MAEFQVARKRLYSLFKDMVDIYSPSGKEEELTDYLEEYLRQRGLTVRRQTVDEGRDNLIIGSGTITEDLLFLGHIDTVPAFDIEQFEFSQSGGRCYGLGTADMKSGCAAMIEGFISAQEKGYLPETATLALVVGEEESGDGTTALLEKFSFKEALVAEPTGLQPCLEHFGYVEMLVRTYGYRRHAAMASRETNAVRCMLNYLLRLEDRIEEEAETRINIRDLHSSESGFAVPDQCAAAVDLHIPPGFASSDYAAVLQEFSIEHLNTTGASHYEIEFPTRTDGFIIKESASLVETLKHVYRESSIDWKPAAFRSHSDANLLRDSGCGALILGPGQLSLAHTIDESVDFEEVVRASRIYTMLLKSLGISS